MLPFDSRLFPGCTVKVSSIQIWHCKSFFYLTSVKIVSKKLFEQIWTLDSYLIVIQNRRKENINDFRYMAQKLLWRGGCRMRLCQEIKCFWRTISCLNIIVRWWNFGGARNETLSLALLLFLWDNALQKLRIPSHFAKCEPLICTLVINLMFKNI